METGIHIIRYGREECGADKPRAYTISYSNMIHFIEKGRGYFNGMHIGAGQAFICRRNHRCEYYPDPEDPWTYSWINIIGEEAERVIDMLPLVNDVFNWKPDTQLDVLHEIPQDNHGLYDEINEMYCLGVLYRIAAGLASKKELDKQNYVERAKQYLKCNYEYGITIAQAADQLHISRAYLRNLFYMQTGMPPRQYLMNLRMGRAEFLLGGDYSVSEIAGAVGYSDLLQFSRIFHKYHGMSPTEYRKRIHDSVQTQTVS